MEVSDTSIITNEAEQNKLKNLIFKNSNVSKKNAFMVSLNESNSPSSGSITATSIKKNPFAKTRKINAENLSVSGCDSINESESEKTNFLLKSKNLFEKKKKSSDNKFNVFFEDTTIVGNTSNNLDDKTVEEENLIFEGIKSNPFQTGEKQQKYLFNIDFDETKNNEQSEETLPQKLQIFQKPSLNSQEFTVLYDDSLTQCTQTFESSKKLALSESVNESQIQRKKNLFKKSSENTNDNIFSAGLDVSKISGDSEKASDVTNTIKNFDTSNTVSTGNKENFEQSNNTFKSVNGISRDARERQNSGAISAFDSETDIHNSSNLKRSRGRRKTSISSSNKSLSKNINATINSEMYNTQSSYNDDNLDNWMSAESDAEMSLPKVSPIRSNFIADEQVPEVVKTTTPPKTHNSLFWEEKFNDILSNASKKKGLMLNNNKFEVLNKQKKVICATNKKIPQQRTQDPTKLKKPAPYANKRLYQYIINKIKPKFGIDSFVKAEELVLSICETVKVVTRKKNHQKKLIEKLKKEMAVAGLIETTVDFNEFIIKFLPYNFRVKVVPCLQPLTNTIYPPRDSTNPFDRIV